MQHIAGIFISAEDLVKYAGCLLDVALKMLSEGYTLVRHSSNPKSRPPFLRTLLKYEEQGRDTAINWNVGLVRNDVLANSGIHHNRTR